MKLALYRSLSIALVEHIKNTEIVQDIKLWIREWKEQRRQTPSRKKVPTQRSFRASRMEITVKITGDPPFPQLHYIIKGLGKDIGKQLGEGVVDDYRGIGGALRAARGESNEAGVG